MMIQDNDQLFLDLQCQNLDDILGHGFSFSFDLDLDTLADVQMEPLPSFKSTP